MKKFTMKKITLLATALLISAFSYAQQQGSVRVSLDLGYAIPSAGGGGLAIYLEPMYNIKDNMSVGVRIGSAGLIKEVESTDGEILEGEVGANGSYMATFDYHFNKSGSSFVPFVGGGLGYVSVANIGFDSDTVGTNDDLEADGKLGGMIRAGFEWGKFRLGLDYNLIPKSDLEDIDGNEIGTSKNSYLGISLGFFVGGGKW